IPLPRRLEYARSCIEILGQVLRNFTGSLPGERKIAILEASYLLALRVLRAILSVTGDLTVTAHEELSKRDGKTPEGRRLVRTVEKFLTILAQIAGVSVIRAVSLSAGSPDIGEEAYERTLQKVGRSAATNL